MKQKTSLHARKIIMIIAMLCFSSASLVTAQSTPTYPPSSVITMPHTNSYFKENSNIVIRVFATDIGKTQFNGTVTSVRFYNGDVLLGEQTTHDNNTYTFVWQCVPAGEYRITAVATNNRGVSFRSAGVEIFVGTNNVTPRGMSANKGKYLGNIIGGTPGNLYEPNMHSDYMTFWNGITAENAHKWGDIFPNYSGSYNWRKADIVYNYAADNNLMFRYHAIAWGSQYPNNLPCNNVTQFRQAITFYMSEIQRKYRHIDQFDVLNENMHGSATYNGQEHAAGTPCFRSGMGGNGTTGHDWVIWLFEQAREMFPNSKLIMNDFELEGNNAGIDQQLAIMAALRDRGLVDGFGTQAHTFNVDRLRTNPNGLRTSVDRMARAGVPVYVTELDLTGNPDNSGSEALQLQSYQNLFPVYWEHPAVAGVTIWGYVEGLTWFEGTGLLNSNRTKRSAMIWLENYIASQPNVGYPFGTITGTCTPVTNPTVSLTAPTANQTYTAPATVSIAATATASAGRTINRVEFFNGTTKLGEDLTAPYTFSWTNVAAGTYTITAVARDNTGAQTTSAPITIIVNVPQGPYGGTPHPIPGTIQFEHFDVGGNGVAYYDDSPGTSVPNPPDYRTDEDVDIENCTDTGGGYNIGYATAGEWLEYTVNVATTGTYTITLRVACNGTGRTVSLSSNGTTIANNIAIPNTTGWQTWQNVNIPNVQLTAGEQIIRITIGATDYVNLNYMSFALTTTPPPTVTTPVTYCQGAMATALTATGTALRWYTTATGGQSSSTAPVPSTASVGNTTYYVSQTVNSIESERVAIVVTIHALPTATITASGNTTFCTGDNVTLNANTGTGLSYQWWRDVSTEVGTGTASLPIFHSSGSYTVEVTNANNCKSISNPVVVTVNPIPDAPTVVSPITYQQGASATALTATGTGLRWYTTETGGQASTTAPTPSTATVGSTEHYVSQTVNECESERAEILVVVSSSSTTLQLQLKAGWNLIGCILPGSTPIETAFADILPFIEQIKDMNGFFSNSLPQELNSLNSIEWGRGYLIKVSEDCLLIW